jgi:antitoxin component of MazEF toxin-antitoxin module
MTQVSIRKAGGVNIISIPPAISTQFGLESGSVITVTVENNRIILTPASTDSTLEELIAGSPKERLALIDEDLESCAV